VSRATTPLPSVRHNNIAPSTVARDAVISRGAPQAWEGRPTCAFFALGAIFHPQSAPAPRDWSGVRVLR